MLKIYLWLFLIFPCALFAQTKLQGTVVEKSDDGFSKPLIGVNIIWEGTTIGTSSNENGEFDLPFTNESNLLIVSHIGYKPQTLTIKNQNHIEIVLTPAAEEINNVEIVGSAPSTSIDYLGIENKSILSSKELQKAACCTLAESFETNPSIDVSFTDAITGIRQIEMLGLAGTYTQTTMEALPYIRGLMSNVGLSFIPGIWIDAINISKGVGSVVNGYESITGQIDIDMQKPFGVEGENPLLFNLYGDNEQRYEGNLNYRFTLNENLSSMTLLHSSSRKHSSDNNSDSFMDMPTFQTFNVMQRWQYHSGIGLESQLGFQIVNNKNEGGTINSTDHHPVVYIFGSTNKLINVYGKTGYVYPDEPGKSFGLQWSYNSYNNSSNFGLKKYDGNEKNLYLNFIYQSFLVNQFHKIRAGASFIYHELNENFNKQNYDRIERVPGIFIEYTLKPNEELSIVAGLRGDEHNQFGFLFSPRLHARYSPHPDWVFRTAVGRGFRISNIFSEYSSSFASSRQINILRLNSFGTGLEQESAWNYGFNLTHYFLYDYRDGMISFDFYRTQFDKITIADLDSNPQEIKFSSVANGAYSNTVQVEINFEPLVNFTTRIAYKFIDSKQLINNEWLQKPFSAKHRALVNLAYSTEQEETNDPQMLYDLTVQWYGKKRIPSTVNNPVELRARETSPNFFLVNAQITRSFNELFDLYLGIENAFDFRQNSPIIDPANPNGQYFDASLIWGPVTGRMVYAGLRYKI